MSEVNKVKKLKPKAKKLQEIPENENFQPLQELSKPEKKPRASRAKPKPTKEQAIKMLQDTSNDIKQIIVDLKDDETKLSSMSLKNVPSLIKETLCNLDEDLDEIEQQLLEIRALPEN